MNDQRAPNLEALDEQEILSYWFPPGIHNADAETYREQWLRWFGSGPEVDGEITERFGGVLERARRGELDYWSDTPRGRLALIIVLDQFSRSVYKGTPLAYAQDPAALRLAQEGIEDGMDRDIEVAERLFFMMPLGHAEGPNHLERMDLTVRCAEEQLDLAPPQLKPMYEFSTGQARAHRDVIARFGRHPHRNAVLGRACTPEEVEYLKNEVPIHMRRPQGKTRRYRMMNLDEAAVDRLLRMEDVIPAMECALADFSSGKVVQPVRTIVPVVEHEGFFALMPAYAGGALGAKLVTFYPQNQDVPTHHATILLFKPETGEPLVSMDGRLITEVRTAAVSAVATKHLARPDTSVLAIIGSGVQARSHLEALKLVRGFEEVRIWSPRNAGAFARRFGGVRATASAEEAVRGADVVVVATTSKTPVLSGEWLSPGAHVNAIGAPRPDWRELDDKVLRRARLYVDSREAAFEESGDVIAAGEAFAEVGEVVAGAKPGRESSEEITLFKSLGLAVEDVATADLIHRRATNTASAEDKNIVS
jgi:ornithine cyclodeaminase/alanine dehydrogenase-like protein (mu-crystallin family)/uncharacterized protein (DUF924 family)